VYKTVPEPERGDLVIWRPRFAEYPRMCEAISVSKRLERILGEGGIKGMGRNIVDTVPLNQICSIRRPVKVRVEIPICNPM
jgi:hypothetical protein